MEKIQRMPIPRLEHLKEGFSPIMVCINNIHGLTTQAIRRLELLKSSGQLIDYSSVPEDGYGVKNKYSISSVNSENKYSLEYHYCTGVIAVGADQETGKNISFVTHHDPLAIQFPSFEHDFALVAEELKQKSIAGSIDVGILGSHVLVGDPAELINILVKRFGLPAARRFEPHVSSITTLYRMCEKTFGFKPTIISGPNMPRKKSDTETQPTNVFFENGTRRLDLVRAHQANSRLNEPFSPSEYSTQAKKWVEEE